MQKLINFLLWLGSFIILIIGGILGMEAYIIVDEWEGHIEGSILPFVVGASVFGIFMMMSAYIYGRFVILPLECVKGED